jgi:hypothetical protein
MYYYQYTAECGIPELMRLEARHRMVVSPSSEPSVVIQHHGDIIHGDKVDQTTVDNSIKDSIIQRSNIRREEHSLLSGDLKYPLPDVSIPVNMSGNTNSTDNSTNKINHRKDKK